MTDDKNDKSVPTEIRVLENISNAVTAWHNYMMQKDAAETKVPTNMHYARNELERALKLIDGLESKDVPVVPINKAGEPMPPEPSGDLENQALDKMAKQYDDKLRGYTGNEFKPAEYFENMKKGAADYMVKGKKTGDDCYDRPDTETTVDKIITQLEIALMHQKDNKEHYKPGTVSHIRAAIVKALDLVDGRHTTIEKGELANLKAIFNNLNFAHDYLLDNYRTLPSSLVKAHVGLKAVLDRNGK